MGVIGLSFPVDIRWKRICHTEDMSDADVGDGTAPPRWQSSIAVFRYVPEEEYQVHPGRRLVYYKVTCTLGGYQPKSDEVEGRVSADGLLTTSEVADLKRQLASSIPCNGALLQFTVSPQERGLDLANYPYVADVQPRQRALYEQATDASELASRSLEEVNVRKGAGSSQSLEVLDVDKGYSISGEAQASASYQGIGGGLGGGGSYTRNVEQGTRSMGQQERSRVETTDSARETRETTSHTTQLTQMYTLLQAYHLGTNRVLFSLSPRPHSLEQPSTFIREPRALDGVQEFFLIVNQDERHELPCVSVRLDTGHLTTKADADYDRSKPAVELSVNAFANPPGEFDPVRVPADHNLNRHYDCFIKPAEPDSASATAPPGYVVESVTDVGAPELLGGSTELLIDPAPPADGTRVTLTANAAGQACFRNAEGDAANTTALIGLGTGFGGPVGTLIGGISAATGADAVGLEEVKESRPGYARRRVLVHWRSATRTVSTKVREVLLVTTRVLSCCDAPSTPPKIVALVPIRDLELETPRPGPADPRPRMSLREANELQALIAAETARVAATISDPVSMPALDDELVLVSVHEFVRSVPRLRRTLAGPATAQDGLGDGVGRDLVELSLPGSPPGAEPNRDTVALASLEALTAGLGLSREDALGLRLASAGVAKLPPLT